MKRFFLFTLALICGQYASAQMMPDSTVQIVAYWEIGDKYAYNCERSSKEINAQGDTVSVEYSSEIMEFEVVGKTETSYQVKLTYYDEESSNPQNQLIQKIMSDCGANLPVLFSTDQHGSLISFDNIPQLAESFKKGIGPLAQALTEQMSPEDLEGFDMQGFTEQLLAMIANPAVIQTSILDDIGRVFLFHGARMELDHTYSFDEPLNFMLPGMEQLSAKTNFWAEKDLTDTYSTVCRTYTLADIGNETVSSAIGSITGLATEHTEMPDSLKNEFNKEMNDAMSEMNMQIKWEQYTTSEIHLNTGWPLNFYHDKYIKAVIPGSGSQEKIESRYMEIILPESEE